MNIKKIKNKEFVVKDILLKYPKTRDSDSLLIAYIWVQQAGGKKYVKDLSFRDFILDFINGINSENCLVTFSNLLV